MLKTKKTWWDRELENNIDSFTNTFKLFERCKEQYEKELFKLQAKIEKIGQEVAKKTND